MRNKGLIFLFILISNTTFSQEKDTTHNNTKEAFNLKDKLFWGGAFWAQFGNSTFINISPRVGYKLSEKLSAGIGVKYQYQSFRDFNSNYKESASLHGGSLFARYNLTDNLFLMSEYEHLNIKNYWVTNTSNWTDFLFIGAGFQYNVGGFTNLNAQVLYDALENPLLPFFYRTFRNDLPIIFRFGVSFGL